MKKLFLLPVILLFTAATYGPPFSVSDFSSLTNRPNPSSVNPVGVVLGKTNAYDGNGGIFVFTPSSTNAVDGDIYLTTTTTGRWVRLTRDFATIQSPLVLSNGTLSLVALTNYFTFLAGTNMQVTVTSNTVTYGMTNTTGGGSGNLITVNGGLVTNFWDNGYITFLNAGGGDYSLNIGDDTISTNKINSTFYNWVLSLSGGGGGTTNGLGVNGTFRTDWNAISSAEIAYTVSAGTNWYGSLVAGSVAANKLATTGTGTSTNFLAGDYSYKYVTTNMIPGLNAILATIGSGGGSGGGLGTNFVLNGVLLQPATITNGLSVIWSTNANGHAVAAVSLVDTNIPSTIARLDSPTFTGTVTFDTLVANTLQVPFASRYAAANASSNLVATSDGQSWTNLNGSSIATGTVADARIDSALARLASPTFTGDPKAPTASPGDNDTSIASTAFVTAAVAAGGGSGGGLGTNLFVNNILSQPAKLTNSTTIVWSTNSNGDIVATATNIAGTTTDNVLQWLGSAYFIVTNNSTIGDFSVLQTNGIVYNATVIGAGENDAPLVVELSFPTRSTNYIWTFRPEGDVNGFVAYEAEGYRTNTSIRFKLHEAVGSTFFTGGYWMRFDLYDKASVGGSGSGLTEAQASLLYQRTNSTLTRVAGIGAGTTGDLLYRDATGWTNLAKGTQGQYLAVTATVPAWSNAPSGGGTTISTNGARTGALVAYQLDGSLATTNVAVFSTNTALGIRAGSGLSSGNFNTFIGYNTATNVTSGNSSVIIGYQAGKDAANAISFTTILGTAAGSTVTADYNTLLGYHAGNLLVSGGNNVSVGYQSGNNTTNGSDNVFVGSQAGTGSGSGSRNTFVGRQAGNANTTANDNVYVGYQAGLLSTTSDANTFVGVEAGETLTAGANNNTFIGYRSGRLITSGYNNTFIGYGSGNTHTIGNNNIFLGINVNGNTNTANHFLAGGSGQPITSVYFGEGIADASPSSFALRATSGTGTDIAGAGITIAGGQSTGSGAGGSLTFQTSPAGSTGTTTNALVTSLLIGSDGKLSVTKTITAAGTTSVQTINKVAGSVNLAAAATSVVVTNSLVSTSSVVIGTVASNDTTAKSAAIVPGSGLFTIYLNAAATAETRVNWIVLN